VLSLNGSVRTHALESEHDAGDDGDVYFCNFECIDTALPYQPPRRTPKPVVHGAQTAVVVGGKDTEIFTDDYGRVRLSFHWDRDSPGNEDSSCWVRVAQVWAGSGFGAVFTPRVGQEVLVDFLEGDPDRPIVTGSVYNSDNKPPYLPLNPSQSGIKTRSTRRGSPDNFNEIRFEDKIGQEQLFMQAEKDHTINVKNNRSATIGAADSISVGASRSVSVTKNLSVTVGTGGAAASTLSVTGTHRTDATDTVDVQAPNHIKLTCGKSTITMTDGKIELVVEGGGKIVIDGNVLSESKDGSRVLLDPNAFMKSSGDSSLLLDKNACMTSSGKSQALLDGDATLTSTTGACNIEGATKVALQGAKVSQLDLDAAGATLGSPTTKVVGKGLTEVTGPMVKIN
jgi:type VI secretion system secreted protein VgrG